MFQEEMWLALCIRAECGLDVTCEVCSECSGGAGSVPLRNKRTGVPGDSTVP